jgi:hypothetical protein
MNGMLGTTQAGAINSGVLGVVQPGAIKSGSLGHGAPQPGSYNSGSLGFHEPEAIRSGSLGRYVQPGAHNSGSMGRGYGGPFVQQGEKRSGSLGCGCTAAAPTSGLGSIVRFGRPQVKGIGGLGAISFDLDLMVGLAIGAMGVWYAMGKKCTV